MSVKTIGILSPGDMGHVVGKVLQSHGVRVLTCLKGRSERTHMLAREAQIDDVPTYEVLLAETEMILSILVPESALEMALWPRPCATPNRPPSLWIVMPSHRGR
jgi:3-hydroxyisobutyrate dehydrogenase-like beta-hydroxyacid dehydrogenase